MPWCARDLFALFTHLYCIRLGFSHSSRVVRARARSLASTYNALQDEIQVVVTKCNLEETGDCRSLKCFLAIIAYLNHST